MANKRKTTTAIVAGVTALALLLGGTFAWTSISQQAKNEAIVDINPGGRLHDDFNGTNKDVYVENFGDETTGVPIFARIRLDQYFEVGQEAGINKDGTDRKVNKVLGDDTDINDTTTWVTYIPEAGDLDDTSKVQANTNWQWALGNDGTNMPIYLPTFNKNKDSLKADINGTYEGTTEGDIVHYDDYKTYTNEQAVSGTEVYDWDDEDAEEETAPVITTEDTTPRDSADVYHKSTDEEGNALTHTAKPISTTAQVMSMADWVAAGSQPGPYWVYDEDGWAYWAQPIAPGETTGLLLDSINMSRVPDDNYYYGINVVGQFATASDWEMFFAPEADGGAGEDSMTESAKTLMGLITDTTTTEDGGDEGENDPSVETPTYYTMDVAYPLESGTTVNLGVQDYTPESADEIQYYIINKENNPTGGSDTELAAMDGMKVVPITFTSGGGAIVETKYYYASPFTNGSTVTTDVEVEGVTLVAMDGDNVVAFTCTKVYDATVHKYLGMGNHSYEVEGVEQNEGCLVFESVATPGKYCSVGDANMGVDGDDEFMVTTGVAAAAEDAGYDYDVENITETACACTASAE